MKKKQHLQLKLPLANPVNVEADYRESLLVQSCPNQFPTWDRASNSLEFRLILERRILDQATDYLRNTRDDALEKYSSNDKQWAELLRKQKILRESFIKFEQFVKENELKRGRAKKKIAEEMELQTKREQMINDVIEEHNFTQEVKQWLEQKLRGYKMYEDFLNGVIFLSETQFRSIFDIIKRYQLLIEKKEAVLQKRARELDELDDARAALAKLIQEKTLQLMSLNSKKVNLISRHDQARNRALLWERIVAEIKDIAEQRAAEVVCIKETAWTIYRHMCGRRETPANIPRDDFARQIDFIKKTLSDLQRAHAKARQRKHHRYRQINSPSHTMSLRSMSRVASKMSSSESSKGVTIGSESS